MTLPYFPATCQAFWRQAFSLQACLDFDFNVIHYREKRKDFLIVNKIRCLLNKHIHVTKINEEQNTIEYDVDVYMPIYFFILDKVYDFYVRHYKHISEALKSEIQVMTCLLASV